MEPDLFIPIKPNKTIPDYFLYECHFQYDGFRENWGFDDGIVEESGNELINRLAIIREKYFATSIRGRFSISSDETNQSLSSILRAIRKLKDRWPSMFPDKTNKPLSLNMETRSITLGVIFEAIREIQHRKLKNRWRSIVATGAVDNNCNPESITDVEKKFKALFKKQIKLMREDSISTHNQSECNRHLFLYIGDNQFLFDEKGKFLYGEKHLKFYLTDNINDKHLYVFLKDQIWKYDSATGTWRLSCSEVNEDGLPNNNANDTVIQIKAFSPELTLENIVDYVFEPWPDIEKLLNEIPEDIEETKQTSFLKRLKNTREGNFKYFPISEFPEKSAIQVMPGGGFIVYGPSGSGKTALCMAISKYLVWKGKIYAPLLIEINNIATGSMASYLASEIHRQIGIDNESQDLFSNEQPYLLIIDNSSFVDDSMLEHELNALNTILSRTDAARRPSFIITCQKRFDAGLTQITPSVLTREETGLFIEETARSSGLGDQVDRVKKEHSYEYDRFVAIIHQKFAFLPGIIVKIIGALRHATITELNDWLWNHLGLTGNDEESIRNQLVTIYSPLFPETSDNVLLGVLYAFLNIGADMPKGKNDIYKIISYGCRTFVKENELTDYLENLEHRNLVYAVSIEEEICYAMRDVIYQILMSENEFSGDGLRDTIVDWHKKFEAAIKYNKPLPILKDIINSRTNPAALVEDFFMFVAAKYSSDPAVLDYLVECGCSIDHPDENELTPFMYAAFNTNPRIHEWFFENKAGTSGYTFGKDRAILDYYAGLNQSVATLKWLLLNYFNDNNGQRKFIRLLDFALANNNDYIIEELLKNVAIINFQDEKGQTPLHVAATWTANKRIIELLLKHGAKLDKYDHEGRTPIHCAVFNENAEIFKYFMEKNKKNKKNKKNNIIDVNSGDINGNTLLHLAAGYARYDNVKLLLEKYKVRTDVRERRHGNTALHTATLCDKRDDKDRDKEYKDSNIKKTLDVIELLVKRIDINEPNYRGQTPLFTALRNENPHKNEIVNSLITHGARLDIHDLDHCTPIVYATDPCINKNSDVIITLVKAGADCTVLDMDGCPVYKLIRRDYPDAWDKLTELGYFRDWY
jgi:ankyrin repeat protein